MVYVDHSENYRVICPDKAAELAEKRKNGTITHREEVWKNTPRDENGNVLSPSGDIIKASDDWHMGHKPGYEFRKHQKSAERRGITRKQFLDEYNNPDYYRPELPKDNLSNKHEAP